MNTLKRDLAVNQIKPNSNILDERDFTDYNRKKSNRYQNNVQKTKPNDNIVNNVECGQDTWQKYDRSKIKINRAIKGSDTYYFDETHNNGDWLRGGEPTRINENYLRKEFGKNTRINEGTRI
jgi:hypothetical protein